MRWLLLLLVLLFVPARAFAHPLAPVSLLVEEHDDVVSIDVKRARVQPRGASLAPTFPPGCEAVEPVTVVEQPDAVVERHRLRCPEGLVGAAFGVSGLSEADVDAVVRVRLRDGRVVQGLLDRSDDSFVVPERASVTHIARSYARSGLQHLLGGLDHLFFVVGLVLLLGRTRRVLLALTAFTLGHGLSMAAAVLGGLPWSGAVAELAIAATLVWLAWRIVARARDEDGGGDLARPYLAALGIGLVHGLGFASAFGSAGLPGTELWVALGSFHAGIEAGQLAVVALALLLLHGVERRRHAITQAAAYGIGAVSFMWLLERAWLLGS